MRAKEFRQAKVEMERKAVRVHEALLSLAPSASVAAPLVSSFSTGIKQGAKAAHLKKTSYRSPFTPARPVSSAEGVVGSHANHSVRRQRFHTLTRHHQAITRKTRWLPGQALASMLAASQTVIANHTHQALFAGLYDRNRRQSRDSTRPVPRHSRLGANDLGAWAEI